MQIHMSFRHLKDKWLSGESQSHALLPMISFRTPSSPSQRNCAEHHTFPLPAAIHRTAPCLLWLFLTEGAPLDTAQEWSCVLRGLFDFMPRVCPGCPPANL